MKIGGLGLGLVVVLLVAYGHEYSAISEHGSKATVKHMCFTVLSDIHVNNNNSKAEKLKNFVTYYNDSLAAQTDFVISTGDNVSFLLSDRNKSTGEKENNKLRTFTHIMNELRDPYFLCMGNHEYKIDPERDADGYFPKNEILNAEKIWKHETGRSPYYSFKKNGYTFLFLNSMRGRFQNRFFDTKQICWLSKELKKSQNALLFFHHPVKTNNISQWSKKSAGTISQDTEPELYELLSKYNKRVKAVFVGHGHMWMHDSVFNSVKVYETASFGDNNEFAFYTVDLSPSGILVKKSIMAPWASGF